MVDSDSLLKLIRLYLEAKEEVIFAFLFGSYAREKTSRESDIDIAVFLKDGDSRLEIIIQTDLERVLKKNVDLIILNQSPATLAWAVLRKGIPLVIKDRNAYLDFLLEVSGEAEDFIDFNLDTYRRKYAT